MTISVLYCHERYDTPRTGGEWAHHYTVGYLASQQDVSLQELNANDLVAFRATSLKAQLWFLKRFWGLPSGTIIVQASESYMQFCLANWAHRLRPRRPSILMLVHSDPFLIGMNWKGKLINGICFRMHVCSADRLIANSLDMGNRLARLGVNRKKIVVISPPAQDFPPPTKTDKPPGVIQIICPANIYPKKGQKVLIEAMRHIDNGRVTALLVGLAKDPEYDRRVRSLVKEYGLEHRVTFAGHLFGQEMAEAYAQSSICVVPSLHEPYGMVVQEARIFGLPVIASNVGGLTEQINDGVDGLFVPPSDADALANAINRLVNDADLMLSLVENSNRLIKSFRTWGEVTYDIYKIILKMACPKTEAL